MLGGLAVLLITGIFSFAIIEIVKRNHPFVDKGLLQRLFFYHILLTLAYYGYVQLNSSDSVYYYTKVVYDYRGESWMDFYGTSTTFVEFVGYPFIKFFGFSYEAVMALFTFFGFLGFIYFYIFFREHIRFRNKIFGVDLLTVIFFLPNLHFWSASFGKGALIFLGIGLYFYSLSRIRHRIIPLFISGLIIYHVRPHVMLVILVSTAIGFVFSTKGLSAAWRVTFLLGATVAFFFIYRDVLTMVGIDEEQLISQGLDLTHRANELGKASSGVDLTSYSLPFQVFTFLYRPLFFDAPGLLGIIVSFENAFYLAMSIYVFGRFDGWRFLIASSTFVKSAALSFLSISIALAQVAGNLGLAMRQKSQVMILFMFVVISYFDHKREAAYLAEKRRQKLRKRLEEPDILGKPSAQV